VFSFLVDCDFFFALWFILIFSTLLLFIFSPPSVNSPKATASFATSHNEPNNVKKKKNKNNNKKIKN